MPFSKISSSIALAILLLAALSGCGGSDNAGAAVSATTQIPSSSGAVTLSWTPPTLNTDGSYLTDLAGYNIYYGLREGEYTTRININNPGIATYVVSDLSPNTYFFVATAFNAAGIESPYSAVVVRVVI